MWLLWLQPWQQPFHRITKPTVLDPTLPVWLHQGVAAKLVRLKGLLPQTDVPALVARHTGVLSRDPMAMAASLDALRCMAALGGSSKSGAMGHLMFLLMASACLQGMQRLCRIRTEGVWSGRRALQRCKAVSHAATLVA